MLDRHRVSPGNFLDRNTQRRCQPLPLEWTWRVVSADDRLHQLRIQSRAGDQLLETDSGFFHMARERFHKYSYDYSLLRGVLNRAAAWLKDFCNSAQAFSKPGLRCPQASALVCLSSSSFSCAAFNFGRRASTSLSTSVPTLFRRSWI